MDRRSYEILFSDVLYWDSFIPDEYRIFIYIHPYRYIFAIGT